MKQRAEAGRYAPYERSWKRRRKVEAGLMLMIVGWIPYGVLVSTLLGNTSLEGFLIVSYMIAIAAVSGVVLYWPCPRCRQPFSAGFVHMPFRRRCAQCGLPRNAVQDPDRGDLTDDVISAEIAEVWGLGGGTEPTRGPDRVDGT